MDMLISLVGRVAIYTLCNVDLYKVNMLTLCLPVITNKDRIFLKKGRGDTVHKGR